MVAILLSAALVLSAAPHQCNHTGTAATTGRVYVTDDARPELVIEAPSSPGQKGIVRVAGDLLVEGDVLRCDGGDKSLLSTIANLTKELAAGRTERAALERALEAERAERRSETKARAAQRDCARPGYCEEHPAASCLEVRRSLGTAATTGDYWVWDLGSGAASLSRCDMDTDGGGWQRLLAVSISADTAVVDTRWFSIGRDLRAGGRNDSAGALPAYSWVQQQVYGRGVLSREAGGGSEFMVVTEHGGATKSKAKATVGSVTSGWFEDNSVMCWNMIKLWDHQGEVRAQHKFGRDPTFPAQISHGRADGSVCQCGGHDISSCGASWDGYWTPKLGSADAHGEQNPWYAEFTFFDSGTGAGDPYTRVWTPESVGPSRGLSIWLRPRLHPSPIQKLGSTFGSFEDMETDGGGWFRGLRQELRPGALGSGHGWERSTTGRTLDQRRVDYDESPPPYDWVAKQVLGGGRLEAMFGSETEFLLKTFYNGELKSVGRSVVSQIGSGWFHGDDECWHMTKLIDSRGAIRAPTSSLAEQTYTIQLSVGREQGERCECNGVQPYTQYCGTSINSLWSMGGSGVLGDFYLEYTFFDDGVEGDHFRRIYDGDNAGTVPRAMEIWLRPPFYPDPRDVIGEAPPNAVVDMALDGGGWLRVFRQQLSKPAGGGGFLRKSVGLSPASARTDADGTAPPYDWVQQQVLGNGTVARRYGSNTEFMIKTFRAGQVLSAAKGKIAEVLSGWFEQSTMCLELTKLEDRGGPIRSQATLTYRQLLAAGLHFNAQISLFGTGDAATHSDGQVHGTTCKCHTGSGDYCGRSDNSYWVSRAGGADHYAELSFFDLGGRAAHYNRVGHADNNDDVPRGIEIYIRPAI